MPFPSTFSSFSRPATTDKLNSPSHSALHNSVSSAVGQLEAVIGTDASVIGTIIGDLRSASSNGGGHVQTANKGGTGQTSYNKGDILVATSSSVLTKLAVGSITGQILTVDPNSATGLGWAAGAASTKVATQYMNVSRAGGASSTMTVFFSASILGSTLGTNNAIKFTADFPVFNKAGSTSFYGQIEYGNNVLTSFVMPSPSLVGGGTLTGVLYARSSVAVQALTMEGRWSLNNTAQFGLQANPVFYHLDGRDITSSVESSATQNLIIRGSSSGGDPATSILAGLFLVEKIA